MKSLIYATLLMGIFFTLPASAEAFSHVYGAGTTNIVQIPTNKVMSKITIGGDVTINFEKDGRAYRLSGDYFDYGSLYTGSAFTKLVGPATVSFKVGTYDTGFVSYEVSDNESTSLSKPSNAVVIPTDATGPVEIVLESSTDLITWTAAEPGLYGSSSPKRFFRVRAIAQ